MTPNSPPPPSSSPPPVSPPAPRKRMRWLLYGCGTLLALLLMVVATVAITLWWIQRPIKPVVLSPPEKAAVDQKLRQLETASPPAPVRDWGSTAVPKSSPEHVELPPVVVPGTIPNPQGERPYVAGLKVLRITEREINGLLNANTDLGRTVRLEFAQDALHAYLAVPIPQDFPVGGGKMFRARGRFRVSLGNGGEPYAILEDVTVFGLSLPNAWLGGLKGQNLIGQAMGGRTNGSPILRGIKSLRIEPGALLLELQD